MDTVQQIKHKLEQAHTIAIFGHRSIDGDALGAMYGLGLQLEALWKKVSYFTPDQPNPDFGFLGIDTLQLEFDYWAYDLLIFVDFSGYGMIERFTLNQESYFDGKEKVIIDHHPNVDEVPNSILLRDDTATSTAELVLELTSTWRDLITPQVATLLFLGLSTDSGHFRHDNNQQSERLLENALTLVRKGADKQGVVDHMYRRKSFEAIVFMQKVLGRIQKDGDIVFSWFSKQELDEAGLQHPDHSNSALRLMTEIGEAQLIIFGKEKEAWKIRISLRGKGKYNCRDLAAHFQWGGHVNAAGCSILSSGNLEQDMYDFVEKVKWYL